MLPCPPPRGLSLRGTRRLLIVEPFRRVSCPVVACRAREYEGAISKALDQTELPTEGPIHDRAARARWVVGDTVGCRVVAGFFCLLSLSPGPYRSVRVFQSERACSAIRRFFFLSVHAVDRVPLEHFFFTLSPATGTPGLQFKNVCP